MLGDLLVADNRVVLYGPATSRYAEDMASKTESLHSVSGQTAWNTCPDLHRAPEPFRKDQ
jgi:hypothetical protein